MIWSVTWDVPDGCVPVWLFVCSSPEFYSGDTTLGRATTEMSHTLILLTQCFWWPFHWVDGRSLSLPVLVVPLPLFLPIPRQNCHNQLFGMTVRGTTQKRVPRIHRLKSLSRSLERLILGEGYF